VGLIGEKPGDKNLVTLSNAIKSNSIKNSNTVGDLAYPRRVKIWMLTIFVVEYLQVYESIFETALTNEPGDPGVLFNEKIRGRKSAETVNLT
jgi:hypothetical protein